MKRQGLNSRLRDTNQVKPTCAPLIRPQFLASVKNAFEARIALAGGADILDCKDPSLGALGAVSLPAIREIVAAVGADITISATIGDLPNEPERVAKAAEAVAAAGAHIVKWGIFETEAADQVIDALKGADLRGAKLVAVQMADRNPDFSLLIRLAAAGFFGVMLDTADKSRGSLTQVLSAAEINSFVTRAHQLGLISGLAGSLRIVDIESLLSYRPGVIGFRGALCTGGRTGELSRANVERVANAIDAAAHGTLISRPSRIIA